MTRGETGRGSAGPRLRTLDRGEVLERRAAVLRQPPSPERSAALRTIRSQLTSIARRSGTAAAS
jgi:hypothetical protein